MNHVGEYKKDSLLAPFFVTLEVIMEIIIPFLMAKLIDNGLNRGDMRETLVLGAVMALCTLVSLFFGVFSGKYAASASAGLAKNLRRDMYLSIQGFSFSTIDKFSSASLVTRLTTDITNVQNAYQMIVRIAVRGPVMMVLSLIMSLTISPGLSMIFLLAIPILGGALYLIMIKAHPIFERVFNIYDRLNNVVQENLRGIRVVKSYVRETHEIKKFNTVSEEIYQDFTKAEKILAFNMPIMQLVVYTCMLLIAWFGARYIVSGTLSTGDLTSLIAYIMQILMSLMMLSMVFVMIIMARASAERIIAVLDETSDLKNNASPVYTVSNGDIVFKNVSFSYASDPHKLSLNAINLTIKSGETIGIIGGTGSAKSSLVQLIPRLYDTTEGSVFVGGVDVKNYDLETLRQAVAMVLQKNVLFSGTIAQNLRFGNPNASDSELKRMCALACADEFIEKMPEGLNTLIEQGGANVSGGQKQRLCIARALLKKPKILILDDSTSAVDTATDSKIRKAFRDEIPDTTKIIIAQRVSSIEDADKIIIMKDGYINAIGTHDTLLSENSIYKDVYYSQTKGEESYEITE